MEHAAWVAAALPLLAQVLRRVLVETDPAIEVPPLDPQRPVEGGDQASTETVAAIGTATTPLADTIAGVPGDDWLRTGRLDGAEVTALDVARSSAELSIYHLRSAEQTVRQVLRESR